MKITNVCRLSRACANTGFSLFYFDPQALGLLHYTDEQVLRHRELDPATVFLHFNHDLDSGRLM